MPKDLTSWTVQVAAQYQLPRIVQLELIVTEGCNLGCTYCFEYAADQHAHMPLESALKAVDFLFTASRTAKHIGVTFMGGEPMLRFELIEAVINHVRALESKTGKKASFNMQTNGTLLTEEHARYFRDVGLHYCLSLDGTEQDNDLYRRSAGRRGSFQQVAERLKMLKRYQHWQGARMTVMPATAPRLRHNIEGLHQLGINQFILGFATHVAWTDDEILAYGRSLTEAFEYFLEERIGNSSRRMRIDLFELGQLPRAYDNSSDSGCGWGCGAGSGRLAVSPNGVFHGCSKLAWGTRGSASAPLPLGSVESGLNAVSNRMLLLDHSDRPRLKCQSCELRNHCQGGCHAANFADTGDIYTPSDEYCKLIFAQKNASDYARARLSELGISHLRWEQDEGAHVTTA